MELRFGRSKITKLTKSKDWESQLIELGSQVEKQQHKFLHRLRITHFDPISLAAVQKDCRIKKFEFIKLLGTFEEMGMGIISY